MILQDIVTVSNLKVPKIYYQNSKIIIFVIFWKRYFIINTGEHVHSQHFMDYYITILLEIQGK